MELLWTPIETTQSLEQIVYPPSILGGGVGRHFNVKICEGLSAIIKVFLVLHKENCHQEKIKTQNKHNTLALLSYLDGYIHIHIHMHIHIHIYKGSY